MVQQERFVKVKHSQQTTGNEPMNERSQIFLSNFIMIP